MKVVSLQQNQTRHDWQLAIAIGFFVLIGLGAVIDRRNTFVDRSADGLHASQRIAAPLTPAEQAREMLTHD